MTVKATRGGLRRLFLLAALLGLAACAPLAPPAVEAAMTDGIPVASPASEGFDAVKLDAGIRQIAAGAYGNIHSLLVLRRGKLVSESYFPGEDENNHAGKIGLVRHGPETLHDVRSVSKSVVALAILAAHDRGIVKSLDQPTFDYFPEYAPRFATGDKARITIRHALTMTAGLDWNEHVPFSDPRSSAAQFLAAPDPLAFVLSRDLAAAPGTEFNYNGGLTQLLAAIIHRTSQRNVEEFAWEVLFAPLGIREAEWAKRRDGEPDADSGLRLRSRDLAKLGLMLANRGEWAGRRILPARLVDEAISEHVSIPQEPEAAALGDRQGYGYQIWRFSFLTGDERVQLVEMSGNGGQKVFIDEAAQLVVVTTAGDYDRRPAKIPLDIYIDIVRPALLDR